MVNKEEIKRRIYEERKKGVFILYIEEDDDIYIYESAYLLKLAMKTLEGLPIEENDKESRNWIFDRETEKYVPRYICRVNSEEELNKYLEENNLKEVGKYSLF